MIYYSSSEEYCRTFDLTTRIPKSLVEEAIQKGELFFVEVHSTESNPLTTILLHLEALLKRDTTPSALPIRICIPSLGSPQWGDVKPQVLTTIVLQGQSEVLMLSGNRTFSVSCISFGGSFANIHMPVPLYLYLLICPRRTGAEQAGFRSYAFYRTQRSPWRPSQVYDLINLQR